MKRFVAKMAAVILAASATVTAGAFEPLATGRSQATGISPYYFGPNALPIPDMVVKTSPDLRLEAAVDYFAGHRGDQTYDIAIKANIPLWTRRANLSLWMQMYEWYNQTEKSLAPLNVAPKNHDGAMHGSLVGDVYVSVDMQLFEEKRIMPDITLRAAIKSAAGGGFELARYYDCPGYFFDTTISKSVLLRKSNDLRLRAAVSGGFLCWQTGDGRQNDAPMYGVMLGLEAKNFSITETFGGYWGWETGACKDGELAHDRPMSLKTQASYRIRNWEILAQYQVGLQDYPYNQFRLGAAWHWDILRKK